jgi:hypothetical protein
MNLSGHPDERFVGSSARAEEVASIATTTVARVSLFMISFGVMQTRADAIDRRRRLRIESAQIRD